MEQKDARVVLVAEDDPNLIYFLRKNLEQNGFHPIIVESGAEALRLANSAHPEVIVLDVGLPDMSGMDLCKTIKQDQRTAEIPVLFLTGHDDISDRVAGLDAGAQDYLVKPFAMPEFAARIRAILRKEDAVQRDKNEFALRQEEVMGIINHELRAPLTVINMAAEILANHQDLPEERRDQLVKSIRGSAGTLTSIVDDLVFLTNPVRHLRLCAVRNVTQEVVDEQRARVHTFDLHLVARLPAQFPVAEIDEAQYRRALAHLIDNAIKFTSRGGAITVALQAIAPGTKEHEAASDLPEGLVPAEARDSWLVVEVKDTGIGIAPEHHRRVFEPFYQVDVSTTRTAPGLGLGLAVVAAFVRAHHGHLAVRSGHGLGTAIHLALPIRQDDLPHLGQEDPDGPASA